MSDPVKQKLEVLYKEMQGSHLTPLWTDERAIVPPEPPPIAVPWLWKWAQLYDYGRRSAELVPLERGGDRRAMGLSNPGMHGQPYVSTTLWAAVQWLNGHEVAPGHRHSSEAVRFIIEGSGAYTTVNGDRVYLERGDFVINPAWHWHDHGSDSDGPMVWMDALDIPLNTYIGAAFFEYAEEQAQQVTAVRGGTLKKYGVGQLRPAWEEPNRLFTPISTYKWDVTERALNNLAEIDASPFDDVALEYTNPQSGGPVLPTMTGWVQMLRPGIHTKAHRQVNSAVYHVFEGKGATIIGGVRFEWERGDIFVIPSWKYHEHINSSRSERAILLSVQDTPVLKALGKYREEALETNGGHQVVTETFSAEKTLTPA
jgi:gentisate 1,2-dioxygenase